jgi:hypothetical protein
MSDPDKEVNQRVEKFINDLLNKRTKLAASASTHDMTIYYDGKEEYDSVRDHISQLIYNYQKSEPSKRRAVALSLYRCMSEAFTHNLVEDGDSLLPSLNWYQQEYQKLQSDHRQLQEKHQKLADDFIFVQGKNKQLEELLDRMVPHRNQEPQT